MKGHTSSVTAITATYIVTATAVSTIVASASSDSTVITWQRDDVAGTLYELYGFNHAYYILGQFTQLQTISFGRGFIMALDFYLLLECDGME